MAAGKGKGRGGDWVLGGRQLFGVFVLLVVIFGMVFTLGYLLGRNQYESLRADASSLPLKPEGVSNKPGKPGRDPAEKTDQYRLRRRRSAIGISFDPRNRPSPPPNPRPTCRNRRNR